MKRNLTVAFGFIVIASIPLTFWLGGYWMLWGIYCMGCYAYVLASKKANKKLNFLLAEAARNSTYVEFGTATFIRRHDEFVDWFASGYACIIMLPIGDKIHYTVYVGSKFFELSDEAKLFLINHELGHLNAGNPGTPISRIRKIILGQVNLVETAADMFAVNNVGLPAAISGLRELQVHSKSWLVRREMNVRIKSLVKSQQYVTVS